MGLDGMTLLTGAPPSVQLGTITNANSDDPTAITYNAVSREDSSLDVSSVANDLSVVDGNFDMLPAPVNSRCLILLPSLDGQTSLALWSSERIDSGECP